ASLLAPQLSRDELTGPRALTWTKLLQAVVLVAIPGYLILREPDLGTTMVFGFILFGVLFLGGATWRQMLAMTAGLGLGILAVWQF
ncbi:MAG: FtsW/RodA/SpoVE family cell cycle protein, partial [Anaerolineae bacterium]|nr:FtsW/RodA/SpoVE family cell cycle protein [Anaerolineae bacterium]NIQ80540.1 FtsW/RodA/SpoVE family cell cycle protein [Anaerolineae bacterium]